jgi:hypothetical protein
MLKVGKGESYRPDFLAMKSDIRFLRARQPSPDRFAGKPYGMKKEKPA